MNGKRFANVLKTRFKKTLATSTGTGRIFERPKNSCIYLYRSQGTKLTVRKFELLAVQKLERLNRGQIFSRHGRKFNRRGVNAMTV